MSCSSLVRIGVHVALKSIAGLCLWGISVLTIAETLDVIAVENRVEFRGNASVSWTALDKGSELELPVEVRTTGDASVVLKQAGSTFTLKPDTRLSFSGASTGGDGLISRIKQWIGTAFYKIERQPDTLSVETPFLVSTIKGTEFVIVTTEQESFVTLTEGSLQVLDLATGKRMMILPGEVTGSSNGGSSARTYQPKNTTEAASRLAKPEAGGLRVPPGDGPPVLPRAGAGRSGEQGLGLGSRGKGFENALQAIDAVRIEQRATAEQRSDGRGGRPSDTGRPNEPGVGSRPDNTGSGGGQRPGDGGRPSPRPGPPPGTGGNDMPGSGQGPGAGGGDDNERDDDDGDDDGDD
ncbi:hypothetical protein [Allohahella marinimesophila]|uniref:hypothetical protein n=1 Tax=Allohahella marinimesophila TaxID=1054972 RepID=UPI0031E24CB8